MFVGWWSGVVTKSETVAKSTTEAEIVTASEAARELVWLNRLYSGIIELKGVPQLIIDNEAAISLTQNFEYHGMKPIKIIQFFVRELVKEGYIEVNRVHMNFR
ncbi:hypothetical protein JTB14_003533 [Gonioctena quinquepunctata]|nr:hypothetical protein JTB14_003533 [Gonioctena quinquepunctata]